MPDNIHPVDPPKLGHFSLLPGSQQALVFAVSSYDISAPGDSGSAVLDRDNRLLGLLFAGSERNEAEGQPATAIINPIKHVFNLLSLEALK